jgi:antitoxin MazE
MTKKLIAIGNSLGIIIEKPILDLLRIERDTQLDVKTDGDCLIIKPISKEEHKRRLKEASAWVTENHRETLRKLAE